MRRCLTLARRGLGRTWPNPSVGCVLVRDGRMLAAARTGDGGRPHAETIALEAAGANAPGSTAYVSLEPCAHHGATPPCADALIAARISRVVIGCTDPNPEVSGAGIARLEAAGVTVVPNVLPADAEAVIRGHAMRCQHDRPHITLKIAATLDGSVATADRRRRQLTGPRAQRYVDNLRAECDGVLIGAGTARIDNPRLLPRDPALHERRPVRIVLDTQLTMDRDSQLVQGAADAPVWIVHAAGAPPDRRSALQDTGVELIEAPTANDRLDLMAVMQELGRRGLTTLLVEAGPTLAGAILERELADSMIWLTAGQVMAENGLHAVGGISDHSYELQSLRRLGDDLATRWQRRI